MLYLCCNCCFYQSFQIYRHWWSSYSCLFPSAKRIFHFCFATARGKSLHIGIFRCSERWQRRRRYWLQDSTNFSKLSRIYHYLELFFFVCFRDSRKSTEIVPNHTMPVAFIGDRSDPTNPDQLSAQSLLQNKVSGVNQKLFEWIMCCISAIKGINH